MLRAQTAPAADDPLLQPWVDYALPAPGQPLPASEEQLDQLLSVAATESPTMLEQADLIDQADASRFRSWMRHLPVLISRAPRRGAQGGGSMKTVFKALGAAGLAAGLAACSAFGPERDPPRMPSP